MEMVEEDVVIVGAGIAGLAVAVALKRLGVQTLILEKYEGLRATGAALTFFSNALLALDALGVSHKLTSLYAPLKSVWVTNVGTGANQEIIHKGRNGSAAPITVHRKALLEALADELPTGSIRFSSNIVNIETQTQEGEGSSIAVLHLLDGTIIKSKILIGCDGIHSIVARWLGLSAPVDSGRSAFRGLAVFPHGHELKQEVRQFVDVGKRAGFIPLNDKKVYWGLTCRSPPKGENMAGNPELTQRELLENYVKGFPEIYLEMVRNCDLSTLSRAPLMFRYPWDILFGNPRKGTITVAGDAMHPMTPDLAHGGCSALEDAVVLGRHIGNSLIKNGRLVPGDIAQAIDGYVKERRWRVTLLVAGSYLSGWIQEGGSHWLMQFLRGVFYKFLFSRIFNAIDYDCGRLPSVSFSEKIDLAFFNNTIKYMLYIRLGKCFSMFKLEQK